MHAYVCAQRKILISIKLPTLRIILCNTPVKIYAHSHRFMRVSYVRWYVRIVYVDVHTEFGRAHTNARALVE